MNAILTILLILSLHMPAARLTCIIRPNQAGQLVCWCRTSHPASRWTPYPMAFCRIIR